MFIATGLGSGRVPVAPGTAGSAVAVGLFWAATLPGVPWLPPLVFLVFVAAGWWSAGPVARRLGRKDPGMIVRAREAAECKRAGWPAASDAPCSPARAHRP